MVKHILNTNDNDFDFVLIGITCPESQYFVTNLVSQALKINLFLSDYIPFNLKENKFFKFSLFRYMDEELGLEYFFIPNTSNFEEPRANAPGINDLFAGIDVDESVKLIKELPKTDYFLMLKGEDLHNYQFKIIDKLKDLPAIIQVQGIEPLELPSKRNLIF